jgi:N-methylhydantoinase A
MTDAFLAIGLLDPKGFNAGRMELSRELAIGAFEALDSPLPLEQRIEYAYRIGLNNVAEGLIDVAIARGVDPRDFSLMAFGAAGPLMLPGVLDEVKARRVIVPPYPGLFSALGLLSSDLVYSESRSAYMVLEAHAAEQISDVFTAMEEQLRAQLPGEDGEVEIKRSFDGRLVGQSWETPFILVPGGVLDADAIELMISSFHDEYESRYGNRFEQVPVEGVTYRVQMVLPSRKVELPLLDQGEEVELDPISIVELHFLQGGEARAGVYERSALKAGNRVRGPAIIREPMSTTHVLGGQLATVGSYGEIVIEPVQR